MEKRSAKKLEELDLELRDLFESLKDFSDNQLNRKTSEGKWSILQNIHHLILSEGFSQKYIEKKLSFDPELKNSGISNKFRAMVLGFYMRNGPKRKSPEMINTQDLPQDTNFWETVKQWKDQRVQLKAYLNSLDPELFKKQLYKHPAAGKLSIYQMLNFFQQHFRRHRKAIEKISKNLPKQIN